MTNKMSLRSTIIATLAIAATALCIITGWKSAQTLNDAGGFLAAANVQSLTQAIMLICAVIGATAGLWVSFSYVVDMILTGNKQSVQILVFSSKFAEIADRVSKELGRGVTALSSMGWYSKRDGKVLVIIARKSQLSEISRVIKETDDKAFISVTSAMSVYGEGFDQIKSGGKINWKKTLKVKQS